MWKSHLFVFFFMFKIDRDRHYARWKKAVQRTMKWEVNDDENQGIKQRLFKSKNVFCYDQ